MSPIGIGGVPTGGIALGFVGKLNLPKIRDFVASGYRSLPLLCPCRLLNELLRLAWLKREIYRTLVGG